MPGRVLVNLTYSKRCTGSSAHLYGGCANQFLSTLKTYYFKVAALHLHSWMRSNLSGEIVSWFHFSQINLSHNFMTGTCTCTSLYTCWLFTNGQVCNDAQRHTHYATWFCRRLLLWFKLVHPFVLFVVTFTCLSAENVWNLFSFLRSAS